MTNSPYQPPQSAIETDENKVDGMFSHLTAYGYQRSGKQAIGFYIAYLLFGLLLGMVAGGTAAVLSGDPTQYGMMAGAVIGVVYCFFLAATILAKRNILFTVKGMVLLVGTLLLAILLGALGGLIPIAYASTLPKRD